MRHISRTDERGPRLNKMSEGTEHKVEWDQILVRIASYPAGVHRLLAPVPRERIAIVERQVGTMPDVLVEMLLRFNGAELFRSGSELISIFGVTTSQPLSRLEWSPDYMIEKFTARWRAAGAGTRDRSRSWAFAIMNYGGLQIIDGEGLVEEWDSAQSNFSPWRKTFDQWLQDLFREGDEFLRDNDR
jgi:hypothetical protein